jgi:plasmid stabilization system protein ParE
MNCRVVVTPRAKSDLQTIHSYLFQRSPRAAGDWLDGAELAVQSLSRNPERCPLAAESLSFRRQIRQLLFGKGNRGTYRILFAVIGKEVYVLHVRHGFRLPLEPAE